MRQGYAMRISALLFALFALAALAAPLAPAQQPREGVAQLKAVTGNVLVSREAGLASGDEGLRLVEGTRVITTANGEATVAYDNGCEVRLKPNQRFEVQSGRRCEELIAQAASILAEPAGAAVASAAGWVAAYVATLPAIGGGLIGLGILKDLRDNQSVSPN